MICLDSKSGIGSVLIGDGSLAYPSTNKNEMNNAKLLTRFKSLTLVVLIVIYAAMWFNWTCSEKVASGVYFYQLRAGDYTAL